MRVLVVASVLLLLSGCAESATESSASSAAPSSSSTSLTPKPKPVVLTDTLHFDSAGGMNGTIPTGVEPNQTELPASSGAGFGGADAFWTYALRSNGRLSAFDATIWVRVVDQLVGLPEGEPSCPWSLQAAVRSPDDQGGQDPDKVFYGGVCSGPGGPTVAPGDYELSFSATAPDGEGAFVAGDTLFVTVGRSLTSPTPNTSAFVLTGAKDFDSRITFSGLKEPVA
ncbi:MAG: hypothetical protein AABX89_00650 [Candidatus Thermoplasmatota archaeon]